jgi:hypothetical protein
MSGLVHEEPQRLDAVARQTGLQGPEPRSATGARVRPTC